MIKQLLFLVLVFALSLSLSAQEQLPTEKRVSFGQDGKMFVNKDLGLYLWLSTSPDENSKKHRLLTDSSDVYANPMYLDTEGYNTVRSPSAVDPKTKKVVYPLRDIIFEVYADGQAPKTSSTFIYSNRIYRSGKMYYTGKVAAKLIVKDEVSGVEKTYYSLGGASYVEFKDTIKITKEGEINLKYYSTDRVGNREEPIEKIFTIDNSAPKSKYEIDGVINEKFVSPNAKIILSSEDNLVGVKAIYYKINDGVKQLYRTPLSVKLLGDDGVLEFYAVDFLNNKEAVQAIGGDSSKINIAGGESLDFEFYVDNTAPVINLDFEGEHSKGKYTYVSKDTKLKVKADDDKSGVDKVFYSTNSTNVDKTYDGSIEFDLEGIAYIRINATDYVGNKSATVTKAYYVDAKAPVSKALVYKPKHRVKDTLFLTSKTKISLSATDNASGKKEIVYIINNGEQQTYSAPFMLTDAKGLTTIKYWSVDNVGNTEEKKSLEVFIDDLPPEIYHHFSGSSIGSKTVRDEEYVIYPSNVQLYIAATDVEAGGERIEYKVNGGAVKTLNPIKGFIPGNYEVEVTAFDVLGNSSEETIKFSIEK